MTVCPYCKLETCGCAELLRVRDRARYAFEPNDRLAHVWAEVCVNIRRLELRIEQLERRVDEMEGSGANGER